jgi:hypothetical protein
LLGDEHAETIPSVIATTSIWHLLRIDLQHNS